MELKLLPATPMPEERKKLFLLLRWLIVIVCATMLVFSQRPLVDPIWAQLYAILILLTNAGLQLLPARTVTRSNFYSRVAMLDIALISGALLLSGQTAADFYLLFFLVLMLSALGRDITRAMISTVLVILIYGLTLLFSGSEQDQADAAVLLRFPFFFIIALFYGFLVHSVQVEKLEKERAAEEEVNRIKARFLSSITHELLSPINLILGHIHMMLTGAAGNLTLEQIRIMDQFQLNAERLLRLVRELVELSNIETKRLTLAVRRRSLKSFFQELQVEIAARARDKMVRADFVAAAELPPIETDWATLRRAMMRIVASAIDDAESGQITVLAQPGPGEHEATLAVLNTPGAGAGQDFGPLLAQLADEGGTAYGNNGFGVGLTVARHLLELLGARLVAMGQGGRSANFAITLPLEWGNRPTEVIGITYTERFRPAD